MGLKARLGRPDLRRYAGRFDVPAAAGDFRITFWGVATLLVEDGTTALMTDGFFSRPPLLRAGVGRIRPDQGRIDAGLARAGVERLAAVVPVHTHYDHAMDTAAVAVRTGAVVVGGQSAANVARGGGVPERRIRVVLPGEPLSFGGFTLTLLESSHCPPDRSLGEITEPVVPPVRRDAYKCGEAWSILIAHTSGRTALVQGSAGFVPGTLAGRRADVVYLGVGQLGVLDEDYLRTYWAQTVETVGARRVVLIHWDDFFRPLDRPLRALPYLGDDLDVTMRVLGDLAGRQGVALHLPTLGRPEDAWAGL